MKKTFKIIILLALLVFIGLFIKLQFDYKFDSELDNKSNESEIKHEQKEKEEKFNLCINDTLNPTLLGEHLIERETELTNYLKKYDVYISYSELDDIYYYGYQDKQVIYGASLIKLVDALYILDNDININSTIKYTSKYYNKHNKGLTKHNVGDDITLDNIVKHALSVSDNGAHKMLIDYIGFDNLKNYGRSLGAEVILTGGDNFGMQTASDTNIYLTRLYELLKENSNSEQFKEYMINDFHSYLNVNNLEVAHKYGYYDYIFHDIGIVFDEHPYAISVLTKYGNKDYAKVINEISLKVYEHHKNYWNEKNDYCMNLVYEKK